MARSRLLKDGAPPGGGTEKQFEISTGQGPIRYATVELALAVPAGRILLAYLRST